MPRNRLPRTPRSAAWLALLSALALPPVGLAAPPGGAREAAIADLAAGKPADAARRLRSSEDPEDLCLRGRALLQAGEPGDALKLLSTVPAGAACARRAAFDAAEALRAKGDLDQAAERQAALAAPLLGADRDREVGEWLEDFARRLLARPARDRDDAAFGLYRLALKLRRAPEARRALAEEVAKALQDRKRDDRETADVVVETLVAIGELDPALLAPLLPDASGVQLLPEGAAEGKETSTVRLMRMRLAERRDARWAGLLAEAEPKDPEAQWLRAKALAEADDVSAVEALAPFVEAADRSRAAEASRMRAEALLAQGDLAGARESWLRHHDRFPADRDDEALNTIELNLARAAAKKGDTAGARTLYDALARRLDPSVGEAQVASIEAAWVALAAGDTEDATRRLETLAGQQQFAVSEAGAMGLAWLGGLSDGRIEAARAVLRGLGDAAPAADEVLSGLDRPALNLATTRQRPGAKVSVRVQSQNLEEIEVRLHRIDPVAYVESGGTPAGLPRLDTAVIAPDRSWKTAVPAGAQPGRLHGFDLPLPDVKAGLYRVTVAGPTVEASAVLLVSDLDVITQRAEGALAVAVFRGGKPVEGAKLRARLGDRSFEGRTNAQGLGQIEVSGASGVLLVQEDGAPALVSLGGATEPAKQRPDIDLHFDRPVYLPGDTAHFRIRARLGAQPYARQTLAVAVQAGGTELPRNADLKLSTDARGVATGSVVLPYGDQDVRVRVLQDDTEHVNWTLAVRPTGVALHQTEVRFLEAGAELTLTDGFGAPRVGAEVRVLPAEGGEAWSTPPQRTDAQGRVRVEGPPRPVPWTLRFQVDGRGPEDRARPEAPSMALRITHRAGATAGSGSLQLEGPPGPVVVQLRRENPAAEPDVAPKPPWVLAPTAEYVADAPLEPDAKVPEGQSTRLVQTFNANLALAEAPPGTLQAEDLPGRATVALADLPAGRYRALAITPDGRAHNPVDSQSFVVPGAEDPRLLGLRDLVPGDTLSLTSAKGPLAVFALSGSRLLGSGLATAERPAVFETGAWQGAVEILAAAPDGRLSRWGVHADHHLQVRTTPGLAAGALRMEGRVTDAAGRPVAGASVLVSVFDGRLGMLETALRTHTDADDGPSAVLGSFSDQTAALTELRHQVSGTSIDPALLAEVARADEARNALAASLGGLGGSRIKHKSLEEIMVQGQSMSGMGISGHGSGGGGIGGRRAHASSVRIGTAQLRPATVGHRGSVLFAVVDTDAEGRFVASAPHPRADGQWRLEVVATDGTRSGTLATDLRLQGPALMPQAVSPGRPGEQAHLVLRITAPTANAGPFTLRVGERRVPVDLPVAGLDLGAFEAGSTVELALLGVQDAELDRATWRFGIGAGEPTAEGGDVVRLIAAPGGGFPAARLALDAEIEGGVTQSDLAAERCLGLLAATPSVHKNEADTVRAALDRAVLDVATSSHLRASPAGSLCLHGARSRGLQLGPPVDVDLGDAADPPLQRARALYARAVLGQSVDEAVLARMMRNAEGPVRGMLARTLAALNRKAEAKPLAELDDLQGILARRAIGDSRPDDRARARALALPSVGDAERADYIEAVADTAPGKASGTTALILNGATVATVDRSLGFDVRVASPAGALSASAAEVPGLRVQAERRRGSTDTRPGVLRRLLALPDGGVGGSPHEAGERCGTDSTPCVLRVGDALVSTATAVEEGGPPPPGLVRERLYHGRMAVLRAVAPAQGHVAFAPRLLNPEVLTGPAAYVIVAAEGAAQAGEAGPKLSEIHSGARLSWAEAEVRRGANPNPWLEGLVEADLDAEELGRLARLRFDAALQRADLPAAELVDHFEALRERAPETALDFAVLARIAEAYRSAGQPNRALDGWRAALGGVFLIQASVFRRAEEVVGPLAAFRGLHGLAARYPAVPAVGSALFHLPQQVAALADGDLAPELVEQGVSATDLRLLAAEWDRAYLADWPAGAEGAQVGFHLSRTLYALRADAEAARWAAIVAKRFPKAPERDGLLLIEGLALARSGEEKDALARFAQVATETFMQADGTEGPSGSRDDAWMAAGRVHEANGDFKAAKEAYVKAGDGAAEDRQALERVQLLAEPLMVRGDNDPAVKVTVANLAEVRARAYRVDLRTLFVRDGGLDAAQTLEITGVSPVFTGTLKGHGGPHPRTFDLDLPLKGRGAWLVQLDGEGASTVASLVVRSRLNLTATDDGSQRRAVITRPDGRPAAGIETRIHSGGVTADRTDVRGVLMAPNGAAILAYDGDDMAFTPANVQRVQRRHAAPRSPAAAQPSYERNLDQRLMKQVQDNKAEFEEQFDMESGNGVKANMF